MKLTYKYYWKALSPDGLLIEPDNVGPHRDKIAVNGYDGFKSEEEANERLLYLMRRHGEWFDEPLTLFKEVVII